MPELSMKKAGERHMAVVDNLEIRISAEMVDASKAIDVLCGKLSFLNSNIGKIGGTSNSNFKKLSQAYSKLGGMFNMSSSASKTLTASLTKSYAAIKLLERGTKSLSKTLENSMNYVETFNYWSVALDKIGADFSNQFGQYGYDSAEAYTKSFYERLKTLNKKMTGYSIGDSGELQLTDSVGLALDIDGLMNYQAKILSVTNSVGLLGETSIDVSKAMSMLASDFSSLTNTKLDTVMNNLQSGLIGQSRALYKYGVDITNATLQTYAFENGITKTVSAMTQGEKMQLRMLAILDQSKVAWGDAANTINSVANQWRIFGQQVSNVSRVFGNLLLPIVQKVIPVLNGAMIALQKLLTTLGFKVWGDNWLKDTMSGISSGGVSGIEDLDDGLASAADSAKKLKTHLLGIDELNVVEPNTESSSAIGNTGGSIDLSGAISDALAEYESVWDKAFGDAFNKAQQYADMFIGIANNVWSASVPFRESLSRLWNEGLSLLMGYSFQNLKDFYTEFLVPLGTWAFGTEGKGLTRLVDVVNNSLMQIDWPFITQNLKNFWRALEPFAESFGEGLINFFEDISKISADGINSIFGRDGAIKGLTDFLNRSDPQKAEGWGYSLGVIATGLLALSGVGTALKGLAGIGNAITGLSTGLGAIFGKTGIIAGIGSGISGIFEPFITSFSEMLGLVQVGAGTLSESFAACFPTLSSLVASITPLTAGLAALGAGIAYVFATNEQVRGSFGQLVETLATGLSPVLSEIATGIGSALSNTLSNLYNNVLVPLGTLVSSVLSPILLMVSDALSILTTNIIVPLAETLGTVFITGLQGVADIFGVWTERLTPVIETMQFLWEGVLLPIAEYLWGNFKPTFEKVFQAIGEIVTNLGTALKGVIKFVTGTFSGDWEKAWEGVKDIFKGIFNGVITVLEGAINWIVDGINTLLDGFNGITTKIGDVIGIDIEIPTISHVKLGRFEYGGFPEPASLFWAGENGVPEILGTVGGRTAVAGGAEITGIRDAVYEASNAELQLLREQNMLLRELVNKDFSLSIGDREIALAARRGEEDLGFRFLY